VYTGKSNDINKFFNRIFIINLKDKTERFRKVTHQFHKYGVKYRRFNAVDGRCTKETCKEKKRQLQDDYGVKITKLVPPAASLVIGTIELLKQQVRNRWKHVLICEDDIVFGKDMMSRFSKALDDIPSRWDLMYLGCGNQCGHRGIGDKSPTMRHKTSLSIVDDGYDWYVQNKDDLRVPCDKDDCSPVNGSKYLSYPVSPGGTWAYAYSLAGAKKMLNYINNHVTDHIDQMVIKAVRKGKVNAIAFDRPIVWHEGGSLRADSDIPWDW
jgi:GR25 family glycosyltransferase involved in LPS biosynthesis